MISTGNAVLYIRVHRMITHTQAGWLTLLSTMITMKLLFLAFAALSIAPIHTVCGYCYDEITDYEYYGEQHDI